MKLAQAFLFLASVFLAGRASAQTPIPVSNIDELRAQVGVAGARVTLAPGTYWLTGPTTRPSPRANFSIFLDLSGRNTTYVFTGVTFKVDTRELKGYGRAFGQADTVRVLQVSGANITVDGLTLSMENVAFNGTDTYGATREYTADWATNVVEIVGSGATLKNCTFTSRGSYPYGYGDAFGKGTAPVDRSRKINAAWIDHRKCCGIRIGKGASRVTLDHVTLHMRSYGHGIFMQEGVDNIHIQDSAVLGDSLAVSDTILAHPAYRQWGFGTYGQRIPPHIQLSKHEDGIRVYTNQNSATNGWPEHVGNVTIRNCRVERMRHALATYDITGHLRVSGAQAYGCEAGFIPSQLATENTFTDCQGDAVNGPLVYFSRSGTNVTMGVELAGMDAPVGNWPIALISGVGHTITLTRSASAGLYPSTAGVNCSQAWREWRHRPATNLDAFSGGVAAATTGCAIDNQTGLPLVLGKNAARNRATSSGGILDKGSNNSCTGTKLVPALKTVTDTWGTYTALVP